MANVIEVQAQIAAICESRKANLPAIEAELREVAAKSEPIERILSAISEFQAYEKKRCFGKIRC